MLAKQRNVYSDEVKLRTAVYWFPKDMKGQRVAHVAQLIYVEKYYVLRIRHFIYPIFSPDV